MKRTQREMLETNIESQYFVQVQLSMKNDLIYQSTTINLQFPTIKSQQKSYRMKQKIISFFLCLEKQK